MKMLYIMLLLSITWQFKTATKTQVIPLETILSIDPSNWTCDNPNYKEQLGAEHDIEQWIEIIKHKDGFDGDLQVLAMVKALVDKVLTSVQHINGQNTLVQVKHIHHQLNKHFKQLSEIESFKLYDINDILGYVEVLNKAKTDEDKLQLATMIANKIAELIQQITEIQLQLNTIPVEIDELYDLSIRVNQKTQLCKDVWAPLLEADNKVQEEQHRQEEEQEQARIKAEQEAKAAEQARIEEEQAKLAEQEEQKIIEQKHVLEEEQSILTPEEAQELEQQAEQELKNAEEEEKETQTELEQAKVAENEAENEAEDAAKKAAAAQETLDEAKEREEEACVDAEEAERRLKAAQEAAEEARKKVEEAERLAEEARKAKECEVEPPLDEPVFEEEYYEEIYIYEEEDSCTDDALEDLIDTLIDAATEPSAYQPSCGYPGCQESPIIVIVEDDDEEQPKVVEPVKKEPTEEEPVEEEIIHVEETVEEEVIIEPTPDDHKEVAEEEELGEEFVEEETIYEEYEEEDDDDFGRLEYPEDPIEEIQYLIYKSDDKHVNTIDQDGSKWEIEVNHGENTKIKGSIEYSYGLWTYFRYNGQVKISEKKEVLVVGGLSGDDSNRLLTTIGEGVYNFQVFEGDKTAELTIDYGKYLDAEWVYVYFGYKEGKANGYVYWARTKVINSVKFTVNYEQIVNKIRFQSGYWNGYKGFNGIITNIRVVLNKDSFIEDEIIMKNAIETEYPAPQQDELEYKEEQHYDKVEYDSSITEPKFHWDLDGYREYSISTWFRYVRKTEKQHQIIFRLTSNEPDSGEIAHGDKVLSLWQTEQNEYEFITYTVEEKDKFSTIKETVTINQESQQLWTYAYFGYNNEDLEYYMEWPDDIASKKFKGWHIVAKYWALYLGQGLKHFFNGKTAYTTIRFGKGSFGVATEFDNYKIGKAKLWPGVQEKKYDSKLINHSIESEYDTLLHDEQDWVTDGVYEYGFGLWTKFFITNPQRIYEKPDRILVAKLQFSDDIEFSVYIGKGDYEFQTYSMRPIKYGKNLDCYWNYIYFSYSKLKQIAVGYVNFNKLSQIQRTVFDQNDSDPANNYARFYVGKSNYIGFNGKITNCVVRMGRGSFINEINEYQIYTEQYPVPIDEEFGNKDYEIQGSDNKDLSSYDTFLYDDDAIETLQYSVYGWFKYYGDLDDQDAQTIIRLTNNEIGHLEDATLLGDRTLTAIQQNTQMIFGTYDIGLIDSEYQVNKQTEIELGEYRGLWMYLWVGYSRQDEQFGWFLGFPDISKGGVIKKILHFSPKYLAVYFGNDGINKQFNGKSRHVHACYGQTQCWYFVNKIDIDDQLPAWLPYKLNNHFEYFIQHDNDALIVAQQDQPALDVEFTQTNYPGSDLEAIYEYGIGIWTRWLMNYPFILLEKADSHSIFRFTSNAQYEDSNQNGDRTISSFVGRGEYQFSTYDAVLNKNSIITGTKFDKELEGYWNFVYFCYKRIPTGPKGIGYVYLSNINVVKRVEIDSAKHWLLRDYARLVIGKKEFEHSSFQGKLFDPRAFLGQGSFIESSEDLLNTLIPKFRNYPPYKEKQDNEPVQVEKTKITQRVFKEYEEKYSGVFEYSVYGFAKGNKLKNVTEWTTLVRVTQNTPDIQSDNDNTGDRTLSIFIDKDKWIYSTYDYGDIETVDDDNGAINHEFDIGKYWGKWTYFYFGYSFKLKQAYAYIRQIDQTQNSYLFEEVYHFVPNYLSVFFADDGYGKMFDGEAFDWYLGIGDGAFTTNPEPNQWPVEPVPVPDRILSALLANQGFNSGRIVQSSTFLQIQE